ncbi:MAG: hypothetical protein IJ644_11045 [Oscillospiraceae bacterium]|nr:hypothetical protein [Oscillospiraceae bacterium]
MSETRKEGKYLCADFLAVIGVMMLLGLEYFKAVGFMEMPVTYDSALPIAGRWFCLSGAMLLSACTGYVLSTKRLSWRSVRPLFRLTYIYLVSSLGAMLMRRVIFDQYVTKEELINMLRDFTATDTAQFAGMYLVLLLFAPFLSAAFHELKTYNARLAFLAVTAGVSTLQPMIILSGRYLIPPWCKMLAPFAGFIGGAFVRKYAKNLPRIAYFFLLILLSGLQTAAIVYICTERGILCYPQFDSMATLPCLMMALLLLSLFHSEKKGDTPLHRFFSNASGGALAALIIGDTVIDFVLPSLWEYFPEQNKLLLAGLGAVPVIFILCCTVGIFAQIPVFLVRTLFEDNEYEEDDEDEEDETDVPEEVSPAPVPDKPKPLRKLEPLKEVPVREVPVTVAKKYPSRDMTMPLKSVKEEDTGSFPIPEPMPAPIALAATEEIESIPLAEPVYTPAQEPKPATLDEILEQQGIPVHSDSIDDLIAKITSGE